MNVRRPGIVLGDEWTGLNVTDSAVEVRSRSPVLLPGCPNPEARLQNAKREHRESNNIGIEEVDHS